MRLSIKNTFFVGAIGFAVIFSTICGVVSAEEEENYTIATGSDLIIDLSHREPIFDVVPVLQTELPGEPQHGNINIEGVGLFGSNICIGENPPLASSFEVIAEGMTGTSSPVNIINSNMDNILLVQDDAHIKFSEAGTPTADLQVYGTVTITGTLTVQNAVTRTFEVKSSGVIDLPKQSGMLVKGVGQSIPSGTSTPTQVVFSNTVEYDIQGEWDTGTDSFTAKNDGKYLINAMITYDEIAGDKFTYFNLLKNGVNEMRNFMTTGSTASQTIQSNSISIVLDLAVDDIITLTTRHGDSTSRSLNNNSFISINKIH